MSSTVKKVFALVGFLSLLMLLSVTVSFAEDTATATKGTPQLGANDPLWAEAMEHVIDQSTLDDAEDTEPRATGTARILWDNDYVYARVEVVDSDVYTGQGPDHEYDSVEIYLGGGDSGSNQWRVSATGVWSGQTGAGRARWTTLTDDGYIVEARIPKRSVVLTEGPLTFEIYINNSTSAGNDRYEVVSAFGAPDTGFNSDGAFKDSLTLVNATKVDERFTINVTAGDGGRVTPTAPGNVLRVEGGESVTFEFIPEIGQVVDVVTLDGEEVELAEDGTYTIEDIGADYKVHATFQTDPGADMFDFIVWNDNFARGEYTTAVIIDLGEGNAVNGSDLSPDMFAVSARNKTQDGSDAFTGSRKITRIYANDEPAVRGYLGTRANSPDYQAGLESGRYIVIEFEFYNETGGLTTLGINNSNSTIQNYDVVQREDLVLADGTTRESVAFVQDGVVNPILDRFTTGNYNTFNYAQYLHRDGNGEVVQGLPLYIYAHGSTRGGTNAEVDQKAAMKSANGAVALMMKMDENPDRFASHILNVSSSSGHPDTADVKVIIDQMIADGLVDANRIYMSGFSMGAGYTNSMMSAYPGFLAAAVPLAGGNGPSAANDEAHLNTAYWALVNYSDHAFLLSGVEDFVAEGGGFHTLDKALVSFFETNEVFVWPYSQYDQPGQRPPMEGYVGHEIEPSVLYNRLNESANDWSILPDYGTLDGDYEYLLDWIFDQTLAEDEDDPVDPDVIADLEDQIAELTERLADLENLSAEQRAELEQIIANLRAEIAALQVNEAELQATIADLLARLEALEARVTELEEAEEDGTTPDGEDPEDPADPTDPKDPVLVDPKPTDPDSTATDKTETGGSGTLPATATNQFSIMLIGLALLVVGAITAVIVRKKARKSE